VRMKLFTLDHRLVLRKAGRLAVSDARLVEAALAALLLSPKTTTKTLQSRTR
jgi:hypothetical protein